MIQISDNWVAILATIVIAVISAVYLYGRQQSKIDSLKERLDLSERQNDEWKKQHTEDHRIYDNGMKMLLRELTDDMKEFRNDIKTLIGHCESNTCRIR